MSWLYSICRRAWSRRRFRHIFGDVNSNDCCTLAYGALELADKATRLPYTKPHGNPSARFSITLPVSISEVRACNYLSAEIGRITGCTPAIRSDLEIHGKLDLDFIALGGPLSNLKTEDCQTNSANRLMVLDQANGSTFVNKSGKGENLVLEPGFDYGMILKVCPHQFPDRMWMACAGRAEWGTSGAAWFLANKWRKIEAEVGDKPFAVVVRVSPGKDESAEVIQTLVWPAC
ncbi:MAG: hypothetical protein P4K98_12160 [Bryobacteraceae bacterium]|nr:hypothetical protein [Bryobacteraceae bacterium]